ncbi:antitoxin VapB family protein [Natronorarus salvus]|uniref:antitoxin VapB family protein n=1 Tax=Natronorarus salvus TaxID=3117733 RepID=UPI0039080635
MRLDDEAYEKLASRKREGESFSDVVKRIAGERSLTEVAGIWEGRSTTFAKRSRSDAPVAMASERT